MENFRVFPVADTLPHQAIADTHLDGYLIKKNSGIQGSLTGIMNNPKYFKDPEKFIPDRFVKNGKFEKDIRVCPFSLGLRNCIGKQLARSEYFKFTIEVVFVQMLKLETHFQDNQKFQIGENHWIIGTCQTWRLANAQTDENKIFTAITLKFLPLVPVLWYQIH